MRKQTIEYTSPLDALIAVAKRLSQYESRHKMDSEEFYDRFRQGKTMPTPWIGPMTTATTSSFVVR